MIIEDEIQHSSYMVTVVDKPDKIEMNVNRNQGREHFKGRKSELYYFTGHTKENCYKLIGYSVN